MSSKNDTNCRPKGEQYVSSGHSFPLPTGEEFFRYPYILMATNFPFVHEKALAYRWIVRVSRSCYAARILIEVR